MDEKYLQALYNRFDIDFDGVAYLSDEQYIADLLALLSLQLVCAVTLKQLLRESETEGINLSGTVMSAQEALLYLEDYSGVAPVLDQESAELIRASKQYVGRRLAATEREGLPLRLETLRERLRLNEFSFFAAVCSLACSLDRGFESLFAHMQGDTSQHVPVFGVVYSLYSLLAGEPHRLAKPLQNPSSVENTLVFQAVSEDIAPLLRPLALRPAMLRYLTGVSGLGRELASHASMLETPPKDESPIFAENRLSRIRAAVKAIQMREPHLCLLCGPAGSGKKYLLRHIASEAGVGLLHVNLDGFPAPSNDDIAAELIVHSLLCGNLLCFSSENLSSSVFLSGLLSVLSPHRIGAFLITEEIRGSVVFAKYLTTRIDFPLPGLDASLRLWEYFSQRYTLSDTVRLAELAAKYTLTPGQIRSVLVSAAARMDGEALDVDIIADAIIWENTGKLSEIADRINVFYRWEDLVLGEQPKEMLRDVCNRIRYRHLVETQWGFGGKSAYGTGVSILLYGPPGTGKTMSAQVIAGELRLPLYRINLAQIISKYIGETAKNLDKVFAEAKSGNVILFFDEADALFAKRTDVKNSNDRHANSESSYLLQKIEEYSGISILATNLASNFDEAFRRRIGYIINIHMPSPAQRLALWRGSFPAKAPMEESVDLQVFADNLEFSGSVIKSAALQAAFFAAEQGCAISMTHISIAVRRELQKLGKSEPHFLGGYSDSR